MLFCMDDLENYAVQAIDGPMGHVRNLFFDDDAWVVRYLLIETGTWLQGRKVLISPIALGRQNRTEQVLPVSITRDKMKFSPAIDADQPVSRRHEFTYLRYFDYPAYWGGADLWGDDAHPDRMLGGAVCGGGDAGCRNKIAKRTLTLNEAEWPRAGLNRPGYLGGSNT